MHGCHELSQAIDRRIETAAGAGCRCIRLMGAHCTFVPTFSSAVPRFFLAGAIVNVPAVLRESRSCSSDALAAPQPAVMCRWLCAAKHCSSAPPLCCRQSVLAAVESAETFWSATIISSASPTTARVGRAISIAGALVLCPVCGRDSRLKARRPYDIPDQSC